MAKRKRTKKRSCPAASLTSDLFIEIISRLPVKAVGRAKCVSKTWRNLIRHPDHRNKLPHTLTGFFYRSFSGERFPMCALHFTNVSGGGCPFIFPSFDYLPTHPRIVLLDCCNGLLLFRLFDNKDAFCYVVCNPATKKWTALPNSIQAGDNKMCTARLGFDPAASSHFHVFVFLEDEEEDYVTGLGVYSSETRGWVYTAEIGWGDEIRFQDYHCASVFLDGCLHCVTIEPAVVVVDTEGKTWRTIRAPDGGSEDDEAGMGHGFIQRSQGCLHYANFERHNEGIRLVVYVLKDYGSQEWILKHSIGVSYVFQWRRVDLLLDFNWVAIHQECNLIFFTLGWDNTLISYDMDRQQVRVIRNLGHDSQPQYLPYVPLYLELEALHI